jgi:hypothetical protein
MKTRASVEMQIAKEPIHEMLQHLNATLDQSRPDSFQTKTAEFTVALEGPLQFINRCQTGKKAGGLGLGQRV